MMQAYAEYKESGVDWLGEIPKDWEEKPVFAVTSLKSVTNCADRELLSVYLDRGVIRFSDITEKRTNVTSLDLSNYQAVDHGDFVLNNQQAWRGSVGVSNHAGIVSPAYIVLKLSDAFHTAFANYLFRDRDMVAHYLVCSKGVGTIQRNLYWPKLKRTPLFLPPLPEQTAIADFLDDKTARIDELVGIKRRQIALLGERKQILIQNAVTKGLNPHAPMKDSGVDWIGKIPAHWETKKIKYAATIFRGKFTHRPRNDPSLYDGEYPFFQTGDVAKAGKYLSAFRQTLNEKGLRVSTLIPKGTVVITIAANIGDVSILDIDACFPDSVVGFSPSKNVERDYLYFALSNMKQQFMNSSIKNTQMNLNVDRIGANVICLPQLGEQLELIEHIEAQSKKINAAITIKQNQITKLNEYKTTLINAAVTGKIKVV